MQTTPNSATSTVSTMIAPSPSGPLTIAGKPVLFRDAKTVLTLTADAFEEKRLCDGLTLNLGDACVFRCSYCYVPAAMRKLLVSIIGKARHADVVVRRKNAINLLRGQLYHANGKPKYLDPKDTRVLYSSTLVDVAANMDMVRETIDACLLILQATHWQIRLLSKSSLLRKVAEALPEYRDRVIYGFSVGTLDDRVAAAIEQGTAKVTKRLEALHWLQDDGFRTYGMICPSLPQADYPRFARDMAAAIRVDKCEDVWAEVINVRGESLVATISALHDAGLVAEAADLAKVCGDGAGERWESYARATFLGHADVIPATKLKFLQYVKASSVAWWRTQVPRGAVLLGAYA